MWLFGTEVNNRNNNYVKINKLCLPSSDKVLDKHELKMLKSSYFSKPEKHFKSLDARSKILMHHRQSTYR